MIESDINSILDRLAPLKSAGIGVIGEMAKGGEHYKALNKIDVVVRCLGDRPTGSASIDKSCQAAERKFQILIKVRSAKQEVYGWRVYVSILGLLNGFSPANCGQIEWKESKAPDKLPDNDDWEYEVDFIAPTLLVIPSIDDSIALLKELQFEQTVNDDELPEEEFLIINEDTEV